MFKRRPAKEPSAAKDDPQASRSPILEMHRICLVCKRSFVSTWTGARICNSCRSDRPPDKVLSK